MSTARRLVLHAVDAVGLVHALLLRIQALEERDEFALN